MTVSIRFSTIINLVLLTYFCSNSVVQAQSSGVKQDSLIDRQELVLPEIKFEKQSNKTRLTPQTKYSGELQKMSNDLMRKRLLQSQGSGDKLRVSPTTQLPNRLDRLADPSKIVVQQQLHLNLQVTNTRPINMRPPGSMKYEFVPGKIILVPNGGEVVIPSGINIGSTISAIKTVRNRKELKKILDNY